MIHRNLGRSTLGACAAALLLAGCGQMSKALPQSNAGTPSARLVQLMASTQSPSGGGAFSGSYSGTKKFTPCVYGMQRGAFDFKGAGMAAFLGASGEAGHLLFTGRRGSCQGWSGRVVLTASKRLRNRIEVRLYGSGFSSPCGQQLSYTVTGGTGRFYHATGSGAVTFQCDRYRSGQYSDQWSGTINF
jgi:hypothetical protein